MTVAVSQPLPRPRLTHVRRRPSLELSVPGLIFCALMSFMGVAAVNSGANLLFAIFGLSLGILMVSRTLGRTGLRKLSIKRLLPEHGVVGRPINLIYEIENRKRYWPSLSLIVAELDGAEAFAMQPHAYALHVAAGTTTSAFADALSKRRGIHHLERCQIITSFPFGFIRRSVECKQKDTLLVYPAIGSVDESIFQLCRSAESTGPMMRPRQGGSDEFYGVKEYRTGDNPRWIYWRRSAHTGTLVAREMTHVSPPRLLLLVDSHLPSPSPEDRAKVENVIALAASLASDALERGLPVGLISWSERWIHIPPNRGKRHCRDILTALAVLPKNPQHAAGELLNESRPMLRSNTTAVLLTSQSNYSSLAGESRGGLVVLAVDSPAVKKGFRFQKTVNFQNCCPVDQLSTEEPSA